MNCNKLQLYWVCQIVAKYFSEQILGHMATIICCQIGSPCKEEHMTTKRTQTGKNSYCCDCRDGVLPFVVRGVAATGPLAWGVGVSEAGLRGKCLMFTLIPSSTTSSFPVSQGVPFLSRIMFTVKLWLFTVPPSTKKNTISLVRIKRFNFAHQRIFPLSCPASETVPC